MLINWRVNRSLQETRLWGIGIRVDGHFSIFVQRIPCSEQATPVSRLFVINGNVIYAISYIIVHSGERCITISFFSGDEID
jgi:hypothetical protein